MTLQEVVARFNTTPFLFAGSGITRRYYGLPDWIGLLTHFAEKVKKDQFAYRYYENKASEADNTTEKLPLVASYIEKDFNDAWFNNEEGIRSDSERVNNAVATGVSPFKAEISEYITYALGHGVTVINARGGYRDDKKKVLMCNIPTRKYYEAKEVIQTIDDGAFFLITDTYEIYGGM